MIKKIKFHGPSAIAPMVRFITEYTNFEEVNQNQQHYTILLIFTNGQLSDLQSTIDEIIIAAKCPLSIIFVGVGKDKQSFKTLVKMDADKKELRSSSGEKSCRDIVQFVDYCKHKNSYATLVRETLKEIPKQFIEYMNMKGILPIDYEKKKQKKMVFNEPEKDKEEDNGDDGDSFFSYLKEKFIKDCMSLGFEK